MSICIYQITKPALRAGEKMLGLFQFYYYMIIQYLSIIDQISNMFWNCQLESSQVSKEIIFQQDAGLLNHLLLKKIPKLQFHNLMITEFPFHKETIFDSSIRSNCHMTVSLLHPQALTTQIYTHTHTHRHIVNTSSSLGDSLLLDDDKTNFNLLLLNRNDFGLVLISDWLKIELFVVVVVHLLSCV